MKDWSEDWVSLYFVEDDLRKFEQGAGDSRKAAGGRAGRKRGRSAGEGQRRLA